MFQKILNALWDAMRTSEFWAALFLSGFEVLKEPVPEGLAVGPLDGAVVVAIAKVVMVLYIILRIVSKTAKRLVAARTD